MDTLTLMYTNTRIMDMDTLTLMYTNMRTMDMDMRTEVMDTVTVDMVIVMVSRRSPQLRREPSTEPISTPTGMMMMNMTSAAEAPRPWPPSGSMP